MTKFFLGAILLSAGVQFSSADNDNHVHSPVCQISLQNSQLIAEIQQDVSKIQQSESNYEWIIFVLLFIVVGWAILRLCMGNYNQGEDGSVLKDYVPSGEPIGGAKVDLHGACRRKPIQFV